MSYRTEYSDYPIRNLPTLVLSDRSVKTNDKAIVTAVATQGKYIRISTMSYACLIVEKLKYELLECVNPVAVAA